MVTLDSLQSLRGTSLVQGCSQYYLASRWTQYSFLFIMLMLLVLWSSSVIGHRSSVIGHRSSVIGHRSSVIGHRSSVIGHRSSVIGHRSSDIGHRSSVIGHRSSVIGHRSSVIGHRSSVIAIIIIIIIVLFSNVDDQHRPYLMTPCKEGNNYINAVFVHVSSLEKCRSNADPALSTIANPYMYNII